jgi:16S rRNA C967 or C1407 C5-methylase (RsmB/RsmF family)
MYDLGAQWMVRLWLTQFGEEEAVRLMECNNQRPTFSLRFDMFVICVAFTIRIVKGMNLLTLFVERYLP